MIFQILPISHLKKVSLNILKTKTNKFKKIRKGLQEDLEKDKLPEESKILCQLT